MAPMAKMAATRMMALRRPKRSANQPPAAAPITAPASTVLVTTSCSLVESAKSCLMNSRAPEMTPVS